MSDRGSGSRARHAGVRRAGRLVARRLAHGARARARGHRRAWTPWWRRPRRASRRSRAGAGLAEPPGQPGAEQRAGHRGRRADREQVPVHAVGRVADHAGDAHAHAHGEVRPDRARGHLADVAEQRRHAQRAEDEPDEAAEQADPSAGEHGRADVQVLACGVARRGAVRAGAAGRCRSRRAPRRSRRAAPRRGRRPER